MFNTSMSPYSLSDIAAVTNGCNNGNGSGFGWGNGDGWWIILLFLLWGRNGWGNENGGSPVTRSDLCESFNFNGIQNDLRGLEQGLCNGFYTVGMNMANGFHGVDTAVCTLGYQTQQGVNDLSRQLADCCCENRAAIAQVRYDMATDACALQTSMANNTRDIIDSQNAGTRAILDKICQMEIAAKDDKIACQTQKIFALELAASQANQNNYLLNQLRPAPIPAFSVPAPYQYTGCGGYGFTSFGNNCCC